MKDRQSGMPSWTGVSSSENWKMRFLGMPTLAAASTMLERTEGWASTAFAPVLES